MEQEAYRHVPYDIDVEQALLGAILADNRAMERASALIKPEHFYDPLHGRIFDTMSQMIERGGVVVTPKLVAEEKPVTPPEQQAPVAPLPPPPASGSRPICAWFLTATRS